MSELSQNREKQHAKELWSVYALFSWYGLFKEQVVNAVQVVSFTRKKRHVQPSVKWWTIIKQMASKQQFLPEIWSKFNSTLHSDLLIECQIKHIDIVRKNIRGPFSPATTA